jgi:hypothetical protein
MTRIFVQGFCKSVKSNLNDSCQTLYEARKYSQFKTKYQVPARRYVIQACNRVQG